MPPLTAKQKTDKFIGHAIFKRGATWTHRGVTFWITDSPKRMKDGEGYTVHLEANAGDIGDGIFQFINPPVTVPEYDEFTAAITNHREDVLLAAKEMIYDAVMAPKNPPLDEVIPPIPPVNG